MEFSFSSMGAASWLLFMLPTARCNAMEEHLAGPLALLDPLSLALLVFWRTAGCIAYLLILFRDGAINAYVTIELFPLTDTTRLLPMPVEH